MSGWPLLSVVPRASHRVTCAKVGCGMNDYAMMSLDRPSPSSPFLLNDDVSTSFASLHSPLVRLFLFFSVLFPQYRKMRPSFQYTAATTSPVIQQEEYKQLFLASRMKQHTQYGWLFFVMRCVRSLLTCH